MRTTDEIIDDEKYFPSWDGQETVYDKVEIVKMMQEYGRELIDHIVWEIDHGSAYKSIVSHAPEGIYIQEDNVQTLKESLI